MRIKFIAEKGNAGNGNKVELSGMHIPENGVPLLRDFQYAHPLTTIFPVIENDALIVEADIQDDLLDTWPAIGFKFTHSTHAADMIIINKSELLCVSLCDLPNADLTILKLSEQHK